MSVFPGFAGQTFINSVDTKIRELIACKKTYGYRIILDGACSPAVIQEYHTCLLYTSPQIPILASGGANFDNLHTWFENGVDSVGLGGLLTKGSSADIAENARKLRAIVEESRKAA